MNSPDCQSVLMLVCLRPLPLVRLLADFLYVRAIELLLSYFNLVTRIRDRAFEILKQELRMRAKNPVSTSFGLINEKYGKKPGF
jgi:hypothetical protein